MFQQSQVPPYSMAQVRESYLCDSRKALKFLHSSTAVALLYPGISVLTVWVPLLSGWVHVHVCDFLQDASNTTANTGAKSSLFFMISILSNKYTIVFSPRNKRQIWHKKAGPRQTGPCAI
jgi:hypothetical protein